MQGKIAVIGGGVVGASIAYHLARFGSRKVLLLEAEQIGAGSTRQSVGGIRTLFDSALEIELSLYGHKAYKQLEVDSGEEFNFRKSGYLLLVTTAERKSSLNAAAELAASLGGIVEQVPVQRLETWLPGIETDDVCLAVYLPEDGFFPRPQQLAQTYADLAAEAGVGISAGTPVHAIHARDESFVLECTREHVNVEQIVLAVNAFSGPLLECLDVRFADYPYPRHVFSIKPPPGALRTDMPMTIFRGMDLMLRYEQDMVLSICGLPEESTMDATFDANQLSVVKDRICGRVDLSRSTVTHAWSGLRAMTPDRRALVGPIPGVPGAWCALGFSGHGLMHAPAVGRAVAEMVLTGHSSRFDFTGLSPERFLDPQEKPPVLEAVHY